MQAIRAAFDDPSAARHAARTLLGRGFALDALSVVVMDGHGDAADVRPHWSEPPHKDYEPVALDPAKDDYPRSGTNSPTELASAPPDARRDYNAGLEDDAYNEGYRADVDREVARDLYHDRTRAKGSGAETDLGEGSRSQESSEALDPVFQTSQNPNDGVNLTDEQTPTTAQEVQASELSAIAIPGFGTVAGNGPLAQLLTRKAAEGKDDEMREWLPSGVCALVEIEEAEGREILRQCGGRVLDSSLQAGRKWYMT